MESQVKPFEKNKSSENLAKTSPAKNANSAKPAKSGKSGKSAADFKRKYFDYYDDVKDHTKGREDW